MRFVSTVQYEFSVGPDRDFVDRALARDDTVVMQYADGFHVCDVADLVCIGTTPNGHLILLEKSGAMTTFNTGTDQMRSQRVPFDTFVTGPSDVSEILALAGRGDVPIDAITSETLARPAPRPAYSTLDTGKYERLTGRAVRHFRDPLAEYIAQRARPEA